MDINRREMSNQYRPDDRTIDEKALADAQASKFHNDIYRNVQKLAKQRERKVKIDGVVYDSIVKASNAIGCSEHTLGKLVRKFNRTTFKEREHEIKVPLTIKIQRIEDDD